MTILLQRCDICGTLNYPRRALCRACLADALTDTADTGAGTVLATTVLHRSFEPDYADDLPLKVGTVRLDRGPHLLAFLPDMVQAGERVRITAAANALGQPVWRADPG